MAAQQTSVSESTAIAFAGMLADTSNKRTQSKYNEEASAEMPFGVMLCRGTDEDNGALLLNTSAASMVGKFVGISLHSHAYAKDTELGDTGLKSKVSLDVLTQGRCYVQPEDTVTPGDPVRVRVVVAGSEVKGAFLTTDDGSADCVDVSGFCRWVTSGSSTVPAVVEIDLTFALGVADS